MYLSLKCGYVSLSQLFYLIHFSTNLIRGTTVYMQTFASVLFSLLVPSLSTWAYIKNNFAGRKGWKITLYTVPLLMIYTLHNKFGKILWCSDKNLLYCIVKLSIQTWVGIHTNSVWGGHSENVLAPRTWCSMLSDIDHRPEGIITRHRATKITVLGWSPDR